MEYYEDKFQQEQDALCDYAQYYTLDICGVEYERGSYQDCVYERDRLLELHKKDGLTLSDCSINHHSVRI